MKTEVEIYDATTVWNKKGKPPLVNIDVKGRISFSVEAVKLLGLKEGMKLAFRTHYDDKGCIYFYQQATGIPLRLQMTTKSGVRLQILCRGLPVKLLKFFGFKADANKSFTVQKETIKVSNCQMWYILKENIHKPVQWRTRAGK